MRVITFQDKYVLDFLKVNESDNPIYECKQIFFQKKQEKLFNLIANKLKDSCGIESERQVIPIWGWVVKKDLKITDDLLNELYNRAIPKCNRMVVLELEIPKEFVLLSNFEIWNDELLFNTVFYDDYEITIEEFNKLFEKQKGAVLQACFPFIAYDFVKSIRDYNDWVNRDYSQTDEWVRNAQAKGEYKEDNEE